MKICMLVFVFVLHLQIAASAQLTAARIIDITPVAGPMGAGGAWVALADDSSSVFYNPAGLGRIYHIEIPYAYNYIHGDIYGGSRSFTQQYVGITYSLRDMRTDNIYDPGTLAVSWHTIDGMHTDTSDTLMRSQAVSFAYGKTVLESGSAGILTLGGGVKFFSEEYPAAEMRGEAFDLGAQWRIPGGFALGAALRNFGNDVQYADGRRRLPTVFTGGIAGSYIDGALSTRLDYAYPFGGEPQFNFGTEFWLMNTLAIRAGYNPGLSSGTGITAGTGLRFSQMDILFFYIRELNIDYAFAGNTRGADIQRISLTVKLGAD